LPEGRDPADEVLEMAQAGRGFPQPHATSPGRLLIHKPEGLQPAEGEFWQRVITRWLPSRTIQDHSVLLGTRACMCRDYRVTI
jgi:hypothetical protein